MSKVFKYIVAYFLLICKYSETADYLKEPPNYVTPCKFADPNFDNCMTKQTQQLFNQLSKGVPGLKNVRPTDPYYIKKIKFNQGNQNVVLKTILSNVIIKGLKDIKVEFCTVSSKDYSWDARFFIPLLTMDSDYDIDGKILVVPLKGNGSMHLELDDLKIRFQSNTVLYRQDNYAFYNVTNINGDVISLSNLKTNMQNLFGGNKELEESINLFFNENWKDVFEAMKPIVKKITEEIVLEVVRKIYSFIPANYFIQDIPVPN